MILEKASLSAKENAENPIYIRHQKDECNSNHIQRIRNNHKESNSPLITDPIHDHGIMLTAGAINTENTNEASLFKQGSILQGVKTNRTFHLLRNKRIQDLIESNLVVTIDTLGGRNCCKRLKKNYDFNISLSCNRVQHSEITRLTSSMVSHSGTSFPTKTLSKSSPKSSHRSPSKQGCTKCINWNYSRRVDHRTNETRDLSKDHIYKNKKFSNTTKEVVKNDDFKEKPQIIMVHHENLITI